MFCCLRNESTRELDVPQHLRLQSQIVSALVSRGHCGPRLGPADMRRTIDIVTYHNVHLVRCHTAAAVGSSGFAGPRPAAVAPYRGVEDMRTQLPSLMRDLRFRGRSDCVRLLAGAPNPW